MKKRITILHAKPAPPIVLPEIAKDHDCVYRAVIIDEYGITSIATSNTFKDLVNLPIPPINTFFRRITASDKVWFVTGYTGEIDYPLYVEFRREHYRFPWMDEGERFANKVHSTLKISRKRQP